MLALDLLTITTTTKTTKKYEESLFFLLTVWNWKLKNEAIVYIVYIMKENSMSVEENSGYI